MDKKKIVNSVMICITLFLVVVVVVCLWPFITTEIEIGNPVEHPDYVGTLTISSVGIEVPLIQVEDPDMMQMVVDKMNCAALMHKEIVGNNSNDDYAWVIGDHNYQKFRNLPECKIDDEAEVIYADGTIKEFIVTKNFTGHNTKTSVGLTDDSGRPVCGDNPGGLILYTCRDTSENVQIVFLQPAE